MSCIVIILLNKDYAQEPNTVFIIMLVKSTLPIDEWEYNIIDTKFTALLSRMLAPEILLTVDPGFPTICKMEWEISGIRYLRIKIGEFCGALYDGTSHTINHWILHGDLFNKLPTQYRNSNIMPIGEKVSFVGGGGGVRKFTLPRMEQNPLNCNVAPKRESMTLPHSPARVATGMTGSCLRTVLPLPSHLVAEIPKRTNDSPMTLPAAAAARSPLFATPPFVPFFTNWKSLETNL